MSKKNNKSPNNKVLEIISLVGIFGGHTLIGLALDKYVWGYSFVITFLTTILSYFYQIAYCGLLNRYGNGYKRF